MARDEFLPASNVMKHFGQKALIWISILIIGCWKILVWWEIFWFGEGIDGLVDCIDW